MSDSALRRRRRVGTLLSGLAALALVAVAVWVARPRTEPRLRITTGGGVHATRGLFADALVAALVRETGARVVPSAGVLEALDAVEAGDTDVAIVPGAMNFQRWPRVREVAPLFIEPLHLLVKQELVDADGSDIADLRGRSISLGRDDNLSHWLAADVLDFLGLSREWRPLELPGDDLADAEARARLLRQTPRDALPDAVFALGMLTGASARVMFGELRYRLVPLPFAEAFSQPRYGAARPEERPGGDHPLVVQREFVYDAVIPAFAYQVEPAIPPQRIHTLGTRLLMVAREDVDPGAVERLLQSTFHTRVARALHPPLTPKLLSLPHELRLHAGTQAYQRRREPLITGASADLVGNVVSIGGALLGGGLFVGQWVYARRRQRRHSVFDAYIRRVATIERRASELELSAELTLPPLLALQSELAAVRGEALERFLSGELDDRTLLSELLDYASSCREVLGRLILHVRDELEEQARRANRP